jgi:uncharacterized RDD family membrane protein YckC
MPFLVKSKSVAKNQIRYGVEKYTNHLIVLKMPEDGSKASLLLRIIAKSLDFIIIAIVVKTIPQVGYIAGISYLLISDGLFDGRSLGKKVIKLRVVSVSAEGSGTFRDSILRNIPLAIAILLLTIPIIGWLVSAAIFVLEFLLMLGNQEGKRLGDDMAGTKVIEG